MSLVETLDKIGKARDTLEDELGSFGLRPSTHARSLRDAIAGLIDAKIAFAKLSESAAGRREPAPRVPVGLRTLHRAIAALTPEPFEIDPVTPNEHAVVPLADFGEFGAAKLFRVPADCDSAAWLRCQLRENGWALRDTTESALRLSGEREADPGGGEGDALSQEQLDAFYTHISTAFPPAPPFLNQVAYQPRQSLIAAFRFARDAGRKEERDFWKPELQDAEMRASKAEAELAAAKGRIEELEGELLAMGERD